ncbi:MAG: phage tail protein, partial [Lactococcus raffinolactis]
LNVNGRGITLNDLKSDITIDSDLQEAYSGLTTNMNSNMSGEFPVFRTGNNTITITGNVTKTEIDNHWRWLP